MSETRELGGTVRYLPPATSWQPDGNGFERAIEFEPGYKDPTRGPKSYGQHGMGIRFLLRGPNGVAQFLMNTGWVPGVKGIPASLADYYPSGMDLGYHARGPQHEDSEGWALNGACEYLGAECWYDGSGLNAELVMAAFIREGEPAVWRALRDLHDGLVAP